MTTKRTSIPAHPGNYHRGRIAGIRVIVIHTGETGEGSTAAEGMGNWFADPRARASAHKGADPDSICTYVPDRFTAWAAPGANADGLQLELAGRAGQTSGQWDDAASRAILKNGAKVVSEWAKAYGIPVRWLTDAELRDGRTKGLATHVQVSRVFKRSDHWDPGPNFPATRFLSLVREASGETKPAPATPKPSPGTQTGAAVLRVGSRGDRVRSLQRRLNTWFPSYSKLSEDGVYGPATERVVREFQRRSGLVADGVFGPATRKKLESLTGRAV